MPYHIAVDGAVDSGYPADGALALNLFTEPANDAFGARGVLIGTDATWNGWTYLATMEPWEPNPPGWTQPGSTVWASWTAPVDGLVSLSLTNGFTILGNSLAVYTGDSLSNVIRLADNRQTNGTLGTQVSFRAEAGSPYQICVGNNETGQFFAGVEFSMGLSFIAALANDHIADRTLLTGPYATGNVDFATASSGAGEQAHAGVAASHSVWWSWTAPASGRVGLSLRDGTNSFFHRLAVYRGESLATLTPVVTNTPTSIPPVPMSSSCRDGNLLPVSPSTAATFELDRCFDRTG